MMNDRPRCLARETRFFKVLVEGFTEKLSIPKAYIKKMPEGLSGTVILHGPSGDCWPVSLSRTSKGTYLAGGWEAFVKHHSLTEDEFLVFSSVRSMHFDVKIYGTNACERGDALTVEASHGPTSLKERKNCRSPRRNAGKITSTLKSKALEKEADEAAYCFTSQFPFFRIQIQPYCLGVHKYLLVPTAFVPKLPPQTRFMMLRIANGRKWKVKYRFCIDWPCRISVGWIRFTSENHIKVGDFCVFELVQEDTFEVHIFRC